jgi:hypothetical protein
MREATKIILLAALLLASLRQSALGYAYGGPIGNGGDSWQVPALSYNEPGDLNAPKNIGEEYRRNTPVMYYTYDETFFDYFGTTGIGSIDKAFDVLNRTFTNSVRGPALGLDAYSVSLTEFPLQTRHINYQAQALGIVDMKSITMGLMTEQLGLTDPVRYAWTLHARVLPPGASCPTGEEYLVVQRNYDFISSPLNQVQYSPYVNNVLYSYQILEYCTGTPYLADAAEYSADPFADIYSPVASYFSDTIYWGDFFTGYTRDDVAGLRALMTTNNVNYETVSPDSLLYTISTNLLAPTVFPPYVSGGTNFVSGTNSGYYIFSGTTNGGYGYGDLAAFLGFITTNGPDAVQAAYPGVIINSYSNTVVLASNAIVTSYYTNAPYGSPYGTPPRFVLVTNYQKVFQIRYSYKFQNIFTNHYVANSKAVLQTTTATAPIGAPYGSAIVTNTVITLLTRPSGDFFVLPPFYTGYCPIDILPYGSIPTVLATTNFLTGATTNNAVTNFTASVVLITYFTNYSYVIAPVTCSAVAGYSGRFQGIGKIKFVKVDPLLNYDSILQQFITPITNNYTLNLVTNGQVQTLYLQRILTQPDFLFSAADMVGALANPYDARNLNFNTANVLHGLAGPGTITTPTEVVWNKGGPVFYNSPEVLGVTNGTPYFIGNPSGDIADSFYLFYHILGSYDSSTNAPLVYASGASIDNLEQQMLVHVSPTDVPEGVAGHSYSSVSFTATGGSVATPYTWSASGLPDGMSLSSGGRLDGTPTTPGVFYFTLMLTGSNGTSVQWTYRLTIQ